MENREAIRKIKFMRDAYQKLIDENVDEGIFVGTGVNGTWKADTPLNEAYREHVEALDLAIAALEKQEQVNTQSVNLTHTTYPNALESLKILESAKDENGYVPMSLVRLAFRNVLEQDRWIPVTERPPEIHKDVFVTDREVSDVYASYYCGGGYWHTDTGDANNRIIAWRPLPEPYQEDEA